MKIVEQFQCPDCYGLHDEKFDAQTCCERKVRTVFALSPHRYWDSQEEARETFYLQYLKDGTAPLDARERANAIEVVYAN